MNADHQEQGHSCCLLLIQLVLFRAYPRSSVAIPAFLLLIRGLLLLLIQVPTLFFLLIRVHPCSSVAIPAFLLLIRGLLLLLIQVPTLFFLLIRVHPCSSVAIPASPCLSDQHRLHPVRDRPLHQVSPEHTAHRVPKLAQVLLPEASFAHHLPLFLQETRLNPRSEEH